MKKIMLMAAAAGMLLAPVASQAVLVTNVYTNYSGTTTYATNRYEQTITVQGTACVVAEGKLAKGQDSNERFVRCAFSTKDILAQAGIERGAGKLIRRQNRYTETLNFTNCFVTTTIYDVTNGSCFNFVTNTTTTNAVTGTKCWEYADTTDFDDEETILAVSANGQVVKQLNSNSNSPTSSKVTFGFHDHGTLDADTYSKNGTGKTDTKAVIHVWVYATGDVSNKLWNVSRSGFDLYDNNSDMFGSYSTRTTYNAKTKCLETPPASGSWSGFDEFYHYFPNPCGSGDTYNFGYYTATFRVGPAVKK
jgi:hypothetical protein